MKQASTWILSDDAQVNPDFYHVHKVYVNYCSSDEFSGTQTEASAETFGFYFSGHLNLVNIFGDARPSPIPSLCTRFTRAGIEWRR